MRLYIDGKNTRTIRMYAEAQIVADTGADIGIGHVMSNGIVCIKRVFPRNYVVDDTLAGIEFVSALEVKE